MPLPSGDQIAARLNAQDLAYERLRDWIVDGPLEAGEPLKDTDIAAMLGVSRTPVREAMIRLSQEGLVTMVAGRGTRVAELDFSRAADLYAMGAVLDAFAAATAAADVSADDIQEMEAILAEMEETEDHDLLGRLDTQFHRVYYRVAGNLVLIENMDRIDLEMKRIERVAFGNKRIRTQAHHEHLEIVEALRTRDAAAAQSAATANWRNSWDRIHAAIEPRLSAAAKKARQLSGRAG